MGGNGQIGFKVYQYDLDGNFIKEYESVAVATSQNGLKYRALYIKLDTDNIYKGFIWSKIYYIKYPLDKIIVKPKKRSGGKYKIIQQYTLDGQLVAEYVGIKKLARELGIDHGVIIKALKGKRKTFRGFIWKYKEDDAKSN